MTLEELNLAYDRLEAAQACRNLVGRLSYYTSAFRGRDMLELFADNEDVLLQLPQGSYAGPGAVRKYCLEVLGDRSDPGMDIRMKGALIIHNVNSDVLQFSEDVSSAHGSWFSPGLETDLYNPEHPGIPADKTDTTRLEASADYCWQRYDIDFVRLNGSWKIQKLVCRNWFRTPFDTPWTKCRDTIWSPELVLSE